MPRPAKIMITAGEASGDRLGAGLARALRERRADLDLFGMGGEQMAREGVRLVQDCGAIAVNGIFEVLARLPAIRGVMRKLALALRRERPDLLVPVDAPDFNLRLSRRAAECGVPVVYFVSPQVWAWRPGRVRSIRSLVRRMLVLFPFETEFYRRAGIPVSFVGHPLAQREEPPLSRSQILDRLGLRDGRPTVALLPGSRRVELDRLLPLMLEAARLLKRRRPDLRFLLPLAAGLPEEVARRQIESAGVRDLVIHRGDFPWILSVCDAGAVAAGTASLEAAVIGLPMVVVYRLNRLSYLIGRALVRVDDVALPNLVAGRRVVPELIQSECTPERIAAELWAYLDDGERTARVRSELLQLRERLGGGGVYDRAADAVLAELDRARKAVSSVV